MTSYVVWDFNGTLLDDLNAAVASVTDMLSRRGRPPMTKERYYELMDVPISKYYEKLFDLTVTPMEVLTREFQAGYEKHFSLAHPAEGALTALRGFRNAGVRQVVLSSFRHERVDQILRQFDLTEYFDRIMGADDDLCAEKVTRALHWLRETGAAPENVLVIGDLVHDFEVARALGARCALVSCGHQSPRDLIATGAPVYPNLSAMYEVLKDNL